MLPMIRPLNRGKTPTKDAADLREAGMSDLPKRVGYTVLFLRMTATEMRKLAEATPALPESFGTLPSRSRSKQTVSLDASASRGQATASRCGFGDC